MEEGIREKIIKATFSLLEKKDMNSISVREIAKKADVNVAAISYYFDGKAGLFSCMMEQYWEDLRRLCLEILMKEKITREEAKSFCLRYMMNCQVKCATSCRKT
jgi:AcrR family transcriptional regulator